MDLRNKNTRKILLQLLDKQLKNILTDNHIKTRYQDQIIKFQASENQKQSQLRQYSPQPQLMRTHSYSEYQNSQEKQSYQLKLKNQKHQQSKDKFNLYKLQEDNTSNLKLLKPINLNTQIKQDVSKTNIKSMHYKADHKDDLKQSSTYFINQENLFKPSINKVSQKIIKQNNQTDFFQRMNISQTRKQEKIKKLQNDAIPSFKPQINNRSKKGYINQNKDILQVTVNLELLEKVRDYNWREKTQQDLNFSQINDRNRQCNSALSQTMDVDIKKSQSPSFRNSTTIKKQSQFQIDFNSPNNNITEMLYEALGDQQYDCF